MNPNEQLRHISLADLAALGLQGVAYIKPAVIDETPAFAVYAADGTQIGGYLSPAEMKEKLDKLAAQPSS